MKNKIRLTSITGLVAFAAVAAFSGCDRQGKQKGSDTEKPGSEFSPEKVGLSSDVESLGKDELGRYWYKAAAPGSETKERQWMFDPKDKTLYIATKDEKTGKSILTEKLEYTAASLGLGAGTEELGKDPYGRYWFILPGGQERRVYDPKTKQLLQAAKNAKGEWEIGAPVP